MTAVLRSSFWRSALCLNSLKTVSFSSAGDYGSGAGKGGGSGGSIREAGGSFGKMEAAHEEQYFRKLQQELLSKIKLEHEQQSIYHDNEIKFHEDAIARHNEAIHRHKKLKDHHETNLNEHGSNQ